MLQQQTHKEDQGFIDWCKRVVDSTANDIKKIQNYAAKISEQFIEVNGIVCPVMCTCHIPRDCYDGEKPFIVMILRSSERMIKEGSIKVPVSCEITELDEDDDERYTRLVMQINEVNFND